jgi:N-methylhydantoinase B/oxoprolinase/acetone carboxylase alpha subunit
MGGDAGRGRCVDRGAQVNPAELQILASRLASVADEMGAVLRRAASSPNIKERADCSAALFTADGELLAQAEHIPVHLGSMPASVEAAIATGLQTEMLLNDPFAGGTHLNDLTMVAPVVVGGVVVGWVANRAHHADVGGTAPGSMPPDALTIDEEGLRLPPTPVDDVVLERVVDASRTPDERRGDLDAQRGANRLGVARMAELVRRAGTDALTEILDYGERRMRAALREFPDGRFTATDVLDSAGPRPEQQTPTRITVEVRVEGDEVTFDFTGTDAQRPGNVNAVEAVTVSAVAFAIRAVADPSLPANGGTLRPVHVLAPSGSVVAAVPPVAVGAGNVEVSQRVADVCLAALAQSQPDRVGAASQGTMNNVLLGSDTPRSGKRSAERPWVHYETVGGGQGARPWADGMSGVHTAMTNTLDTPVEALERALPLRVRRYGLRRGSGGAGTHRGGDGIWRELEALAPTEVSLVTERRSTPPPGLAGGEPGAVGENWLLPGGNEARAQRLPDKCVVHLEMGDVLRVLTPGGGGWGPPPGGPPHSGPSP